MRSYAPKIRLFAAGTIIGLAAGLAAVSLAAVWMTGCRLGPVDPPTPSQNVRAEKELAPGDPVRIRIAPRRQWTRLNPDGPYLVSPRVSPDGRQVLASGKMGVGLYLVSADGGRVRVVDRTYRGPADWMPPEGMKDAHAICLLEKGRGRDRDRDGVRVYSVDRNRFHGSAMAACPDRHHDPEKGRRIFTSPTVEVYHHTFKGAVTRAVSGRGEQIVVAHNVWEARVSRNGKGVACSSGTMRAPELFVWTETDGAVHAGRGVHPAWTPNEKYVIFASPSVVQRLGGTSIVTDAELYVFDVDAGRSFPLTFTADVAEMQPAVFPRGNAVVVADWRTGALYRADLTLNAAGGRAP